VGVLLLGFAVPAEPAVSYLTNGSIRIGVDLDKGGAITYLADVRRNTNVVNSYDLGREIQQSYYSGPQPFDPHHNVNRTYKGWPWNPVQSGDVYGHRGRVLQSHNDGKEIYVKSRPMQWALNNVPGEAIFETWIHLDGIAARVRCRLTNMRTDTTQQFSAWRQESPAVYTVGTLYRLFTYEGSDPFTGDGITELPRVGPPWQYWRATENWSALVDASNWGLGVYHPGCGLFAGGFYGKPGTSFTWSVATGYTSPQNTDVLDHDIVYEYQYDLILGSLKDIRRWIYNQLPDPRPDYRFLVDRQHWLCPNGDAGLPSNGYLRVNLAGDDPTIYGPPCAWRAEDVPRLYITAAYHVPNPAPGAMVGQLFWACDTQGDVSLGAFSEPQSIRFDVLPDGQFHTYELDLWSCPAYQDLIVNLRFDPVIRGSDGDWMDLMAISYRPDATPVAPQPLSQ
jgi:hypothetical protein